MKCFKTVILYEALLLAQQPICTVKSIHTCNFIY